MIEARTLLQRVSASLSQLSHRLDVVVLLFDFSCIISRFNIIYIPFNHKFGPPLCPVSMFWSCVSSPCALTLSCILAGCTERHTAAYCNTLQHPTLHCDTLRHATLHCDTLQRVRGLLLIVTQSCVYRDSCLYVP